MHCLNQGAPRAREKNRPVVSVLGSIITEYQYSEIFLSRRTHCVLNFYSAGAQKSKLEVTLDLRVFPRRLTSVGGGAFLAIHYNSRTIGYCFPYCILEIFV